MTISRSILFATWTMASIINASANQAGALRGVERQTQVSSFYKDIPVDEYLGDTFEEEEEYYEEDSEDYYDDVDIQEEIEEEMEEYYDDDDAGFEEEFPIVGGLAEGEYGYEDDYDYEEDMESGEKDGFYGYGKENSSSITPEEELALGADRGDTEGEYYD